MPAPISEIKTAVIHGADHLMRGSGFLGSKVRMAKPGTVLSRRQALDQATQTLPSPSPIPAHSAYPKMRQCPSNEVGSSQMLPEDPPTDANFATVPSALVVGMFARSLAVSRNIHCSDHSRNLSVSRRFDILATRPHVRWTM